MGYVCLYLLVMVVVFSVAADSIPRKMLRRYKLLRRFYFSILAAVWPVLFIALILFISLLLSGVEFSNKGLSK